MCKRQSMLVLVVALAVVSACMDPTGPADGHSFQRLDDSLDPARLSVGDYIATPCAFGITGIRLEHLRDRHEQSLVDIYFGRATADGPWEGPTTADVAFVRAHGGRVLYRFNVPAVRALISLSSIPDLVEAGYWITMREVPDPMRHDVPGLGAGFTRPLRDSDVELYIELGGRVDCRFDFINALSGVLPDRSIPSLRNRPDVAYVHASGVACLA